MIAAIPISLGAVEGHAVKELRTDAPASPSPYDTLAICRVTTHVDGAIRNIERLTAHLKGSGSRVPPIATQGEIERIQVALDQARAAWRSECMSFPPVVRGHLSEE